MATQNSGHAPIQFSVSTPFRHVRLMEVPEDLLDVITDRSTTDLKFKSAPPSQAKGSVSTGAQGQREGILHLCSGNKAWAVKQVSTSNSVYLIQPTRPSAPTYTGGDGDMELEARESTDALETAAHGAVTAVAQVGSFLELHPVKIDEAAVEHSVVELLPIYHPLAADEEVDLDLQASNDAKVPVSVDRLVDDVAVPDGVVRRACARLAVFENSTGNGSSVAARSMVPSTRALLNVWAKIVEGCAIEGIKLDQHIDVVRVTNVLIDELETTPAATMLKPQGTFDQLGLTRQEDGRRTLKPQPTSHFVAGLILSSHPDNQLPTDEFTNQWTDLLPSSFVKHCTTESLTAPAPSPFETTSDDAGGDTVRWTGPSVTQGVVLASALTAADPGPGGGGPLPAKPTAAAAATASATDKKRKWHEKFGAQRSAKK